MTAETAFKILIQSQSDKPEERQFAADIIAFANQTVLSMTRLVLQELVLSPQNVFHFCKLIKRQGLIDEILPDLIACYERQTPGIVGYELMNTMIELGGDKPLVIDFALRQLSPNTHLSLNHIALIKTIMNTLIKPRLKQLDSALILNSLIPIYKVNDRDLAPTALKLLSSMGEPAEFLIPEWVKELKTLAYHYSSFGNALVKGMSPEYLVKALINFGTDAAIQAVIDSLYLAKAASAENKDSHEIVKTILAELKQLDDARAKLVLADWDKQ